MLSSSFKLKIEEQELYRNLGAVHELILDVKGKKKTYHSYNII